MKIIWKDDYSVGVKSMDEQHQRFIEINNKFYDLLEGENPEKEILFVITDLKNYAHIHFKDEEELLKEHGYELLVGQVKSHEYFNKKVEELFQKAREGEADKNFIAETAKFIGDWLLNHILKMDKEYGKFLNEKGIY
jgi:hemerythrin